jgi:hypothetical protein
METNLTTIMLLVDWEVDEWVRIYPKVLKNSTVVYTYSNSLAKEGKYPEKISSIKSTALKIPKYDPVKIDEIRQIRTRTFSQNSGRTRAETPEARQNSNSINIENYLKQKLADEFQKWYYLKLVL